MAIMATLAESFLADLEDLSDDDDAKSSDDEEEEQQQQQDEDMEVGWSVARALLTRSRPATSGHVVLGMG